MSLLPRAWRIPSGMKLVNLLLGGWTGVVFLFLYVPIGVLVAFSFNNSRLNVTWEGFTTKWYRILWSSDPALKKTVPDSVVRGVKPLLESLYNSLIVASISTIASVILGTIGAWLLYRFRFKFQRIITTLALVPMIIPEIIMGISLLIFFAKVLPAADDFNKILAPVWGVTVEPVFAWLSRHVAPPPEHQVVSNFNFDFVRVLLSQTLSRIATFARDPASLGYLTIIISHVTFCFPFVMVAIQARLSGLDPSLEEAAMDLGATPAKAFWLVMVPFLLPAIISGALMSFTLSMDELIVTYFVYSPDAQTFPIRIFGEVKRGLNPSLNAISTLFILSTAVLVVVAEWIRARSK